MTLDEAGDDEEEKPDEEQTEKNSRPSKRKHDDDEGLCRSVRNVKFTCEGLLVLDPQEIKTCKCKKIKSIFPFVPFKIRACPLHPVFSFSELFLQNM